MTVDFTGTAVQWIGPKNTNGGIADVYLDGSLAATVDTYSPAGKLFQQVLFSKTGLTAGSHTLEIVVTGTENPASSADTVVIDAINVPTAAQQADFFPAIPQQSGTSITLDGRDSRLLTANYDFAGQHLVYSTSELDTQASIGGRSVALFYDPAGTDGETVLQYASQPTVKVLSGFGADHLGRHHGPAAPRLHPRRPGRGRGDRRRQAAAVAAAGRHAPPRRASGPSRPRRARPWSRAATWCEPPSRAAGRWRSPETPARPAR